GAPTGSRLSSDGHRRRLEASILAHRGYKYALLARRQGCQEGDASITSKHPAVKVAERSATRRRIACHYDLVYARTSGMTLTALGERACGTKNRQRDCQR